MTNTANEPRVYYDVGCMKSLNKLPDRVKVKFLDMMSRYMSDPSSNGLNLETVQGGKDSSIKSVRVDQGYRAIAFQFARDLMFVHVNEHDKAYRWAEGRRVKLDPETNRVRIIQEIETDQEESAASPVQEVEPNLFDGIADKRLLALGVQEEELARVRRIADVDDLEAREENFDALSFNILYALAAGYSDEEVDAIVAAPADNDWQTERAGEKATAEAYLETDESRETIFTPGTPEELRRFFEGELEGWRVFLHPDQRKLAYRDYNGPAMVRGGAGTGKTVVAMHRAKYLADKIQARGAGRGDRVLLTTFTNSLAKDIESNLRTLCPEHLEASPPRIEVINLDRWVSGFLKRKNFERRIAYFGEDRYRLDELWDEVFANHALPSGLTEPFVRSEWAQIIQAKGVADRRGYLKVSRAGRGTPLDRRKRAALWDMFEDYRMRMLSEGLAEPDDAYREAIEILQSEASGLSYASVVVDEAQDMGEQAFRLVRAMMPQHEDGDDRNAIFIVGDAHQRIYARKASMSACGIHVRGRSRRLRLNYRTTHEIRAWAVSVLEGVSVDDLDEGIDTLNGYVSVAHGPAPEMMPCSTQAEELKALREWIIRQADDGASKADIGVLAATNQQVSRIASFLESNGEDVLILSSTKADNRTKPGIRVTTMHRSKGLEFSAVAVPFLSDGVYPPEAALKNAVDPADEADVLNQFRSLLHVAATRAIRALYVSWSGAPTALVPRA
jgi:superfamily I DNA/RNA helicase